MFYGVIGGQAADVGTGGGAGGGGTLPDGALAIADFVNGTYLTTTATLTAADVVSAPGQISSGVGLFIAVTDVVELIGDLATLLFSGDFTLVIDWFKSSSGGGCTPIHMSDVADNDPNFLVTDGNVSTQRALTAQDRSGGSGTVRFVTDYLPTQSAPAIAAVTRTDGKIAASFNGRAVVSTSTSSTGFSASINHIVLGGNTAGLYGDMTIKKIVIYPAQDDAALPGLSAG
jgi:hypothetical protein